MKPDIKIIRETFSAIAPHAEEVLTHFYETLFASYPAAQKMFTNSDMAKQKMELASSLSYVIENWENKSVVSNALKKLGTRHVSYGTRAEHYDWVGRSLMKTLSYFFEDGWTKDIEAQWLAFYEIVSRQMIEAAATPSAKEAKGPSVEVVEAICNSETLEDIVRLHARDILSVALAEEFEAFSTGPAREKVRTILKEALEAETKTICGKIKKTGAAA